MRFVVTGFILSVLAGVAHASPALDQILRGDQRSPQYMARDGDRHPAETLAFFGITPDMTVVEIWPGGGWYTEILAPYLRDQGLLYAAHFDPASSVRYFRMSRQRFADKLAASPQVYGKVITTVFDPPGEVAIAPAGSADAVLTFRNVHNWYMRGGGEDRLTAAFQAMYRALKPGGTLGLVDHRLPPQRPLSAQDASGYMREDYVVQVAEKVGFRLVARSQLNANPLDNADHPEGVWTLPPSLRGPEQDSARYLTIGESDRMTLRFAKPK